MGGPAFLLLPVFILLTSEISASKETIPDWPHNGARALPWQVYDITNKIAKAARIIEMETEFEQREASIVKEIIMNMRKMAQRMERIHPMVKALTTPQRKKNRRI